ncbi:MAG: amidohydrolase family protein [Pseudomonadota bacterium]
MSLPKAQLPTLHPQAPKSKLPENACDAHIHMLADDFPLWSQRVEDPQSGGLSDWLDRYAKHRAALGITRTVVVHSILYGSDNALTKAAVAALGSNARGIGLVTDEGDEADIDELLEARIMGVRLNYVHGGVLSWDGAKRFAPMLKERGMHVQMLMQTDQHMIDLAQDVAALPVPVCFDHIGWPDLSLGITDPGFQALLKLVGEGQAYVKLSAPYRVCDAPYEAAAPFIDALAKANPDHCLWGSDWPHIMLGTAKQPDAGVLLNHFLDIVTTDDARQKILCEAPERLYGF